MQTDPQFKLRIPPDALAWLKAEAKAARRPVNAEILVRLEQTRRPSDEILHRILGPREKDEGYSVADGDAEATGDTKAFAARLVRARAERGISQAELAEEVGMATAQISRYEGCRASPRPKSAGKLARALGVSFEWLMFGDEDQHTEASTVANIGRSLNAEIAARLQASLDGDAEIFRLRQIIEAQAAALETLASSHRMERAATSAVAKSIIAVLDRLPPDLERTSDARVARAFAEAVSAAK